MSHSNLQHNTIKLYRQTKQSVIMYVNPIYKIFVYITYPSSDHKEAF